MDARCMVQSLTKENLPRYWYSVVYALPNPELGDRVSVALVVSDDDECSLDFIPHLPKLGCIVNSNLFSFFKQQLEIIKSYINNSDQFLNLPARSGPHFQFSPPRELYTKPDERVLEILKMYHLTVTLMS